MSRLVQIRCARDKSLLLKVRTFDCIESPPNGDAKIERMRGGSGYRIVGLVGAKKFCKSSARGAIL